MKKSNLMEGAFIATVAIILSKVLGVLYVIPFYAIVGESGGALYGYAYNIYNIFLIISSAGIPLAISKITSEYNTLNKDKEKKYMYSFTKKIIWIFSIASFLICFLGAPIIAKTILGNLTGGNTIDDVTFVIRCVSFALLVVPILSIARGYLQGHKFIAASSFSQVIEQLFRIAVIIAGSFIAIELFDLSTPIAVGIAVSGAAVGAIVGFIYLYFKSKNIDKTKNTEDISHKEKKLITKKLLTYSIPFIVVNLSFYIYSTVDMILIIRTLNFIGMDASDIETISSIFTTWSPKLISIVTAIGGGLVISLIPSMVAAYTKKKKKEVNNHFGKAMQVLLMIVLPLSLFLSIHSTEIWNIFYGDSYYGPIIFRYLSLLAFFDSSYLILGCIMQNLNKNKLIYISISLGLGLNAILDVPLMLIFNEFGIYPYYGAITATLIGYLSSALFVLYRLKKDDKISYNVKNIWKNIVLTIIILVPLNILLNYLITNISNRIYLVIFLGAFALISAGIYYIINKKLINSLLGENFIKKLLKKN